MLLNLANNKKQEPVQIPTPVQPIYLWKINLLLP